MKKMIISYIALSYFASTFAAEQAAKSQSEAYMPLVLKAEELQFAASRCGYDLDIFTTPELMAAANSTQSALRENLGMLRLERMQRDRGPSPLEIYLTDDEVKRLAADFVREYNIANETSVSLDLEEFMGPIGPNDKLLIPTEAKAATSNPDISGNSKQK